MVDHSRKRIAVVGGGITGLAAAWDLLQRGCEVSLFEASPRVGGVIQTIRRGPYTFENGPSVIRMTRKTVPEFLEELGLSDETIAASQDQEHRFLYFHGRLQALPSSLRDFMGTELLTWRQKLRVAMEHWVKRKAPGHEESVAEFFGRRLGRGITMTWIDIVVSGIYAGNPNRLGITSAFPELKKMEEEYGSVFKAMRVRARSRREDASRRPAMISFKRGLGRLVERLEQRLEGVLQVNTKVVGIARKDSGGFILSVKNGNGEATACDYDGVIVAAPAATAAILLAPFASEAADLLFEVEYVNVVVAHAGFDETALPQLPVGYGFLVPRCMRLRSMGWIFNSQVFPEQNEEGKISMTGIFGGSLDPHCIELSDEQTRHLMMSELALALGNTRCPKPEVFEPVRWKSVMPQLNVGHKRRMEAVQGLIRGRAPGLVIAGNWVDGPSLEKCIASGRRAAAEVAEQAGEDSP